MNNRKTLMIVVGAAAALAGLIVAAYIIIGPRGGTPIIIKGFDDGSGGELATIDGSPTVDTNASATDGKNHHTRLERIERLYVLEANGSCVDYSFGNPSSPQLTMVVNGAKEIVLNHSLQSGSTVVLDLLFDDVNTYQQTGGYYKRKQSGSIDKVIVEPGNGTTCTDLAGKDIKCPTEFGGSTPLTIIVNYTKSQRCTR